MASVSQYLQHHPFLTLARSGLYSTFHSFPSLAPPCTMSVAHSSVHYINPTGMTYTLYLDKVVISSWTNCALHVLTPGDSDNRLASFFLHSPDNIIPNHLHIHHLSVLHRSLLGRSCLLHIFVEPDMDLWKCVLRCIVYATSLPLFCNDLSNGGVVHE